MHLLQRPGKGVPPRAKISLMKQIVGKKVFVFSLIEYIQKDNEVCLESFRLFADSWIGK